jgi:hypothetical protein
VVGSDGQVHHQTASPFWALTGTAWESLGGGTDTRGVAASWQGPDHLLVLRVDAAGSLHYIGWDSVHGWGVWVADVGQALVPAWLHELVPGPPGPKGLPGPAYDDTGVKATQAGHTHSITGTTQKPVGGA